jgi:hypothetical protein
MQSLRNRERMSRTKHADKLKTLPDTKSVENETLSPTFENESLLCNISRRNYTRASSQCAAQYFRIIRSS